METACAECGARIVVPDDAIVGEIVSCKECGSEYEVGELAKGVPVLKPAEEVGEDWGE